MAEIIAAGLKPFEVEMGRDGTTYSISKGSGEDWHRMILTAEVFQKKSLLDYGYSLWLVYAVWILVIFLLYPLSKKYMYYKANNKDKWWLSYL